MTTFLYVMIIAGILNLVMGVMMAMGGRKTKGSLQFALFSFTTFFWAVSNVLIYETKLPVFVRLSYSIGALIPIFLLTWIFQYTSKDFKKWKSLALYVVGLVFMILPFVGNLMVYNIRPNVLGGLDNDEGTAMVAYTALYLVAYGIILIKLLRLYRGSDKEARKQAKVILAGFALYGLTGMTFSLILPAFGHNGLIDFDVPNTIIFVSFTTYAIVEYKWMNVKVIVTQIFAMAIVIMSLAEIFVANTLQQRIYKALLFAMYSILSVFLVRSVIKEVQRKEELQTMSDKLAEANDQLRKLDNAKSEFISIASHQLRTPLTAVKGFISMLLEGSYGKMAPEQEDVLNKVYVSNERLVTLVEDLLNISRIESGRMEFKFAPWDMDVICQEIMNTFIPKAKNNKLSLEYKKPDGHIPEVMIDGTKVREVVSNMVDNALKYTPKGGVTMKLEQDKASRYALAKNAEKEDKPIEGPVLRVTVSDTGIGIPKTELPYLFAKFSRGKDTSRLNTGGTGLGLYVGRGMIEQNGGKIWAESDGEGKGSRFTIEIPIQQSKELLERWG